MTKHILKYILIAVGLIGGLTSTQSCARLHDDAGGRAIESLTNWEFLQDTSEENSQIRLPENSSQWTALEIPHCFRLSGLPEKSAGFYRQIINPSSSDSGKCFYLFLEGAGSVVDLFVNGTHIGQHKGAYTACWFDLTPALKFGQQNEIILRVTNRDREAANCLSQSNLFYTNGGLYRPAWLVKTSGVHIFPDMGSTGVYLTPKNIVEGRADLEVTVHVRNSLKKTVPVVVRSTLTDPNGEAAGVIEESAEVPEGDTRAITGTALIVDPILWNVHDGKLYSIFTEVLVNGQVVDSMTERTGIRTIEMKNGDFVLNNEKVLVRGVCKHHQDEHVWNAMTDEMLKWEMDGMIDLGVNTIRLAHYPHRRFEYSLADEHGVLVWAENGLAGQNWDKGEMKDRETGPSEEGDRITTEMVMQNWNHPSIVFWSSGNETHEKVASHYADTIRSLDKTRLITYAVAPGHEKPSNLDFAAGNTYQGWYGGNYTGFSQLPHNQYVSETGAGSWITQHLPYGVEEWKVDHFESEEYCGIFAEFRFQTIFRNNPDGHKFFLWWNYREFYDRKFKKNRNTKGILTLAGMPKDYYYHFQSFLRPDVPVLHLCGRHWFYRQVDPANGIKAYSNADSVELFLNGVSQGVMKNGDYLLPGTEANPDAVEKIIATDTNANNDESGEKVTISGIVVNNVFFWKAPLAPGRNVIEVRDDRGNSRSMVIYQKADVMPVSADSLVVELKSSNPDSPALFIDRPIEAQGPFYTEVDGSSDNTFDALPGQVEGARWIATRRLSDNQNRTDLSFKVTKPSTVYVMHSTGTYPVHTLDKPNEEIMRAAAGLKADLVKNGFTDTGVSGTWRRHSLWLADTGLLSRYVKAGETINIPGRTLDYVVLIKPE
ncbi:MAG TPA: glycoside hydrolase family 2 TIM barrel-domain containing protein [Pontiella sp.]